MAKVLVVDDDADMLELFKFHLDRSGHEASAARGGADALERAARDRPDIVLLDMRMPVLDGLGVLRILRSHAPTEGVGVILMSAGSLDELLPRLASDERVRCLEKPLDFGELEAAISDLLAARAA